MVSTMDEVMREPHFRVVIFGSARIREGTHQYKQIYALAKRVGELGLDLVTGGGPGLMDAAMSGHFDGKKGADVHGIGLQIRLPKEQRDSKHLDIKEEFSRFAPRLDTFVALADVVIVAPGGVGTMLELAYVWQLMQVHQMRKIPIILLGDMWPDFVRWVREWPLKHKLLDRGDVDMLYLAKDSGDAMRLITLAHEQFAKRGRVSPDIPADRPL